MLPVLRNGAMPAPFATAPLHGLDSLFGHIFGDDGGFLGKAWSGVAVAVWEDDDHIHVEAELPGVSDQEIDLTVHNGMLFIRGERKPEEGRRYLYQGRSFGRFERAITLPDAVQADAVKATLTDGVLRIDLPRSPEARPRKITLQAG